MGFFFGKLNLANKAQIFQDKSKKEPSLTRQQNLRGETEVSEGRVLNTTKDKCLNSRDTLTF